MDVFGGWNQWTHLGRTERSERISLKPLAKDIEREKMTSDEIELRRGGPFDSSDSSTFQLRFSALPQLCSRQCNAFNASDASPSAHTKMINDIFSSINHI